MAKLFESKSDAGLFTEDLRMSELELVDFEADIFETVNYSVKATIMITSYGEPFSAYGVFNKRTGVMEADTRQYAAAIQWAKALEKLHERALDLELDLGDPELFASMPERLQ